MLNFYHSDPVEGWACRMVRPLMGIDLVTQEPSDQIS